MQYRFNDHGLFIIGSGGQFSAMIDFSIIDRAESLAIDSPAGARWAGAFRTPAIAITLKIPAQTKLYIHGAYFEAPESSTAHARGRQEKFLSGLIKKLKKQ